MSTANGPLFDPQPIAELRLMDADGHARIVVTVIEMFENAVDQSLARLEAALQGQDVASVIEIAHILKSSSGNIGAREFSRTCERLEKLGTHDVGELKRVGLNLCRHLKEILPETRRHLGAEKSKTP